MIRTICPYAPDMEDVILVVFHDPCKLWECRHFEECEKRFLESMSDADRYNFEHMGCPAYPMCEENPIGCEIKMGDKVEMFGHKD
jgi:hypothetical protein